VDARRIGVRHGLVAARRARRAEGRLGLLTGSACPHYDGEAQRRPTHRRLVSEGGIRDGWAADDRAALGVAGEEFDEVVASRPGAAGYCVGRTVDGFAERRVERRYLGP
jgi:hypothetical protein